LIESLKSVGFAEVEISYYWYLGQASVVNNAGGDAASRLEMARLFAATLEKGLPLTRSVFKYVGFVATL
jgi:hypothetical protein